MAVLDEIIEQIEENLEKQWIKYWSTDAFPDRRGKYYDHSVSGYFTQINLHSRDYRDGARAAVFVEANYVTLHSGERLGTFYVLKIDAGRYFILDHGAKAENIFKLARNIAGKNS